MNEGCAHCGGAATVVLREDGAATPICAQCLDRITPGMRLGNLRKQFLRDRKVGAPCPHCGWTNEQLTQTGMVGCPLCYEALDIPSTKVSAS